MTQQIAHILVVEDDPNVSDVVRRYLEREGYRVTLAADGLSGLAEYRSGRPDLVVLDLMLPKLPGIEVCRALRIESEVPVIMLTALGDESDRIAGLSVGADDYLSKPFSPRELVLRVAAVLRRAVRTEAAERPGEQLTDGELILDPGSRVATLRGTKLNLTVREFDLLEFLLRHPGQVFSRAELLERVWDWTFGDQSTVTVHVRRLREKIEDAPAQPKRLVTVWGVGYRFEATS
ncbi:response regulator transcription factor [Stackebrandtia nassauensis]|uniref:Two component transcriptional regulator, winged helix family n=1 Tax=Stackebrandtia nassauensis (strain DSM 44728 / CIP 108903 / NRRL B-16338 / NBRC 102104 / LLR-40K-21) TaxID=446470 RepID=D3Q734_STANL|nr:response regulator transcription factor [Stackebrandtia nassauensis]ADD40433.1 two component transcriptional regulator, winged helix family [Stackebrandtia nassauensis DSM 44728]